MTGTTARPNLTGLTPGTGYHFRVSTTTGSGTAYSADQSLTTPLFSITNLGDNGNVSIMAYTGSFDGKNPDGTINDQPRKAVATEYFKTHPDTDYLVYLSSFDYAMPEAGAKGYYNPVKNDTQGINQPIIDNSGQYGSNGKLQGIIDLGNISQLASNPYSAKLDETVTTLNHELMHRFGAYVRFKNPDGTMNTALIGKDSAHWSYLLDSKGSLMYGSSWQDNKDGTFTATSAMSGFSPLDLYLMGLIPKEEVPPMTLIENAAIDKNQLPSLGATITGTAKTVTIDDIIAAEGARIPDAATSPKQFKVGFVLLTRPGDNATAAISATEALRNSWAGRFAELTQGKGSIAGVAPSISLQIDSPADGATIIGPDTTIQGSIINSSGAETGITVNGQPATVTGSRFIANHVPLQSGVNRITVIATEANGLTATTTRSVTSQAGNYLRISNNIDSGTGPLDISLRLDGSFDITNPSVSVHGPLAITLTQGRSNTDFTAKLTVEGTYTIIASVQGSDGNTYSDNVTVTVVSKYQLESLLKSKWEGMRTALAAGDVEGAASCFASSIQQDYREAFTEVGASLPSLNNEMNPIDLVYVVDGMAKCRMTRTEQIAGHLQEIEYALHYTKENGLWKLQDF